MVRLSSKERGSTKKTYLQVKVFSGRQADKVPPLVKDSGDVGVPSVAYSAAAALSRSCAVTVMAALLPWRNEDTPTASLPPPSSSEPLPVLLICFSAISSRSATS